MYIPNILKELTTNVSSKLNEILGKLDNINLGDDLNHKLEDIDTGVGDANQTLSSIHNSIGTAVTENGIKYQVNEIYHTTEDINCTANNIEETTYIIKDSVDEILNKLDNIRFNDDNTFTTDVKELLYKSAFMDGTYYEKIIIIAASNTSDELKEKFTPDYTCTGINNQGENNNEGDEYIINKYCKTKSDTLIILLPGIYNIYNSIDIPIYMSSNMVNTFTTKITICGCGNSTFIESHIQQNSELNVRAAITISSCFNVTISNILIKYQGNNNVYDNTICYESVSKSNNTVIAYNPNNETTSSLTLDNVFIICNSCISIGIIANNNVPVIVKNCTVNYVNFEYDTPMAPMSDCLMFAHTYNIRVENSSITPMRVLNNSNNFFSTIGKIDIIDTPISQSEEE